MSKTTDNQFTLSSGVKVTFRKMGEQASQRAFTRLLQESKLNKKGELQQSDDPNENLKLLARMDAYYDSLIAFGVTLVGNISDYVKLEHVGKNWLKRLVFAGEDLSKYGDLDDDNDLEFIFLRFYAFTSAEDYQVLSEQVLSMPTDNS